ncbi:MAG: DNA methyltransferase [Candidatus Odinarchaeota archaeon]
MDLKIEDISKNSLPHDVKIFLDTWIEEYNETTDDYKVNPFLRDLPIAKKLGSLYSMHRYWTKQPISIIEEYIKHYTEKDNVVLDPFCGVGSVGTAALKTGRNAVLSDLSPIATFIAKHYTSYPDLGKLDKAYEALKKRMKPVLTEHYITNCVCGSKTEVKDYIYTEVYQCKYCDEQIVFVEGDWEEIASSKKKKFLRCTTKPNEPSFSRAQAVFVKHKAIALRYHCNHCMKRKNQKAFKKLDEADVEFLNEMNKKAIGDWYPTTPVPEGHNTRQPLSRNVTTVDKFFTRNTLAVLSKLWKYINDINDLQVKDALKFVYTSIIYRTTLMYRLRVKGAGGILSGTLYFPPLCQDINVWDIFEERYKKIKKGWEELRRKINPVNGVLILTKSATDLSFLSDNSIDYVYTDPPYAGNINYSELNLLWEAWLGKLTNTKEEAIINQYQGKGSEEYKLLILKAFKEIFRVLKPGRCMTLVYHHSSPEIWKLVQEATMEAGFHPESFSKIDSKMTTAKQTASKKTAQRFMVINFLKPSKVTSDIVLDEEYSIYDQVTDTIMHFLNEYPGQTYDKIYDHCIKTLFMGKKKIKHFDLEDILEKNNFKQIDSEWYNLVQFPERNYKENS